MSTSIRQRLEAQGFYGLDDATLREISPWLRWSPALCTLGMLGGVALASLLYAIDFVGNLVVPKTIDSRPGASVPAALVVNLSFRGPSSEAPTC